MFEMKLDVDPYLEMLLIQLPDLHSKLLIELSRFPETKVALTRHQTLPTEILRTLSREDNFPISNILTHPNCPAELIDETLKYGSEDHLNALSQNCSLNENQIRQIAALGNENLYVWIARRPDCPSDILNNFFSIYEKQLEASTNGTFTESDLGDSLFLFDDEDVLFDTGMNYSVVDEYLLEAIASNPNTPGVIFKKLLTMNLHQEWISQGNLGSTLIQNPSLSSEDKAFLALQGFLSTGSNDIYIYSMINYYGLPTSIAFDLPDFSLEYKEALNLVGHPSALLQPDLAMIDREYSFNDLLSHWLKTETIYKTLWPELSDRADVTFFYLRSSYDGDSFYFNCDGVEFVHEFSRGSATYNSMSYPFIERSWAETIEEMSLEMCHENFSFRDFEDFFGNYGDDNEEFDLILAAMLSKHSWKIDKAVSQFSLTDKGEKFVCEWADTYFEDDRDMQVRIHPKKALPYSWKAMSPQKKLLITQIIIDGFEAKEDTRYQFAEHFLACIALHLDTPDTIKEQLRDLDSDVISQALSVSEIGITK